MALTPAQQAQALADAQAKLAANNFDAEPNLLNRIKNILQEVENIAKVNINTEYDELVSDLYEKEIINKVLRDLQAERDLPIRLAAIDFLNPMLVMARNNMNPGKDAREIAELDLVINTLKELRSKTVAAQKFAVANTFDADHPADLTARLGAIDAAIAAYANVADAEENQEYLRLLAEKRDEVANLIIATKARAQALFDGNNFDGAHPADLGARFGAVEAAKAGILALGLDAPVAFEYIKLLDEKCKATVKLIAEALFNANNFNAEADLEARLAAVDAAKAGIPVPAPGLDALVTVEYTRLLDNKRDETVQLIAQALFDAHNFDVAHNDDHLDQRLAAVVAAFRAAHHANALVEAKYKELLQEKGKATNAAMPAFLFARNNFDGVHDADHLDARLAAVQAVIGGVDALGYAESVKAEYKNLLQAKLNETNAAMPAFLFARNNFDAEADLAVRKQNVEGVIAGVDALAYADSVKTEYKKLLETKVKDTAREIALANEAVLLGRHIDDTVADDQIVDYLKQVAERKTADVHPDQAIEAVRQQALEQKVEEVSEVLAQKYIDQIDAQLPDESNLIQLRAALRNVVADFEETKNTAPHLAVAAEKVAQTYVPEMPAPALLLSQTAARIAQGDATVVADVKLLTPQEHGKAANLAVKKLGW